METSLKTDFAQIFSRCPKNLSCPKFGGGAAAPLAPPARTPKEQGLDTALKGLWHASAHVRQLYFCSGEQFFKIGVWWRNPLPSSLRGRRKKGRGKGEGKREKGKEPSSSPQSPSPFSLPPYPLPPTPFDACYAGYFHRPWDARESHNISIH